MLEIMIMVRLRLTYAGTINAAQKSASRGSELWA